MALVAPTHPHSPAVSCGHPVQAHQGAELAARVWNPARWRRGKPKRSAVALHRRQIQCAAGPGHRAAIKRSWAVAQHRYRHERHRCRGGTVVEGRVSYFGGGLEASGHYTSEPGIALNIAPGTDAGWNNSTTRAWLDRSQRFRVSIAGHVAVLPVTDLGPAGSTGRAIDVTEGGVGELGLSGGFPTDDIGTAKLIPGGC